MQQTKKFKMADAISPYLAVSCGLILEMKSHFNSSHPSTAYVRQWTRSALIQIMACRLSGAKPLSKPMLCHDQLDP